MRTITTLLLCAALAAVSGLAAADDDPTDQSRLIKPVDKPLNFVFIPKLIHPWYDTVRQGAEYAAAEFKQAGITVTVRFDPPPVADLNEHIKKIESAISSRPDGIAVAESSPKCGVKYLQTIYTGM
ncbi:MAG: hypothetical protein LUE17_07470, partial [Planctomycetaceae bacterium]|nr:hypothetical protein [Planctomycetaceae bacterium]